MRNNKSILAADYHAARLNQLKADYVAAALEATDNGKGSFAALYTLGERYARLFGTLSDTCDEAAYEFPGLVAEILELGQGKLELAQKGGNLWISSGHYTRGGQSCQYKRATYNARRELKALGCCWSSNNNAWYYNRRTVKERAARRQAVAQQAA